MSYAINRMVERRMHGGLSRSDATREVLKDLEDLKHPTDSMCQLGGDVLIDGVSKFNCLAMWTNRQPRIARLFKAMIEQEIEKLKKEGLY